MSKYSNTGAGTNGRVVRNSTTGGSSPRGPPGSAGSGGRSRLPGASTQSSAEKEVPQEGVYVNERLMYTLTSLIGCQVEVHVRNGDCFEGVFKTFSHHFEVVLLLASRKSDDGVDVGADDLKTMIIRPNEIVYIEALNVDPDYAVTSENAAVDAVGSKTNGQAWEKELEPWDDGMDAGGTMLELEDCVRGGGWSAAEMIRTNEEIFKIRTSFDPDLSQYTTTLRRLDTAEYRERERKAEQLAQEIERSSGYRDRAALENGDNEQDEEMAFSAVHRTNNAKQSANTTQCTTSSETAAVAGSSTGKYVAPHLRSQANRGPSPAGTFPPPQQPGAATVVKQAEEQQLQQVQQLPQQQQQDQQQLQDVESTAAVSSDDVRPMISSLASVSSSSTTASSDIGVSGRNIVKGTASESLKEFSTNFVLSLDHVKRGNRRQGVSPPLQHQQPQSQQLQQVHHQHITAPTAAAVVGVNMPSQHVNQLSHQPISSSAVASVGMPTYVNHVSQGGASAAVSFTAGGPVGVTAMHQQQLQQQQAVSHQQQMQLQQQQMIGVSVVAAAAGVTEQTEAAALYKEQQQQLQQQFGGDAAAVKDRAAAVTGEAGDVVQSPTGESGLESGQLKKSSLNPLAKEFNPLAKSFTPGAVAVQTPPMASSSPGEAASMPHAVPNVVYTPLPPSVHNPAGPGGSGGMIQMSAGPPHQLMLHSPYMTPAAAAAVTTQRFQQPQQQQQRKQVSARGIPDMNHQAAVAAHPQAAMAAGTPLISAQAGGLATPGATQVFLQGPPVHQQMMVGQFYHSQYRLVSVPQGMVQMSHDGSGQPMPAGTMVLTQPVMAAPPHHIHHQLQQSTGGALSLGPPPHSTPSNSSQQQVTNHHPGAYPPLALTNISSAVTSSAGGGTPMVGLNNQASSQPQLVLHAGGMPPQFNPYPQGAGGQPGAGAGMTPQGVVVHPHMITTMLQAHGNGSSSAGGHMMTAHMTPAGVSHTGGAPLQHPGACGPPPPHPHVTQQQLQQQHATAAGGIVYSIHPSNINSPPHGYSTGAHINQ